MCPGAGSWIHNPEPVFPLFVVETLYGNDFDLARAFLAREMRFSIAAWVHIKAPATSLAESAKNVQQ